MLFSPLWITSSLYFLFLLEQGGEGWRDWKDWRRLEAANREDEDEGENEEPRPEGESLVDEDEDRRIDIFPTVMSLDFWRSLENATCKRAGEEKREAMQAFTASDPPVPPLIPAKKRNRHQKRPGGKRMLEKQKQQTIALTATTRPSNQLLIIKSAM